MFVAWPAAGHEQSSRTRRRRLFPDSLPHLLPHLGDKAKSLSGYGTDQALLVAAVAERFACRIDVTRQSRLGHDPPAPDRFENIVPADDMLAVLHQVDQQIEDLRPNSYQLGPAGELPPVDVERVVSK